MMKKLLSFILMILLCASLCSCRDRQESDEENHKSSYQYGEILNSTDFSGGYAWLNIKVSNKKSKVVLVDTDFNEIYSAEYNSHSFDADFGQTVGYYRNYETDVCVIVNAEGEVVATSEDGEFDGVMACGDRSLLVYKYYPADYRGEEEERYGCIDDTGNWTIYELDYSFPIGDASVHHVGDDIFLLSSRWLVNSMDGTEVKVGYISAQSSPEFTFYKDMAIFADFDDSYQHLYLYTINASFEVLDITEVDDYHWDISISDNVVVYVPGHEIYVTNYGPVRIDYILHDVSIERYDLRECSNIDATNFESGCSMLTFTGADEKNYFMLIDTEGKDIIPPTECDEAKFSEGIVVYSINEKVIGMNTKGDILFENKPYMTAAFEFYNGIGRASATIFVNTEGKIILGSK